MSDSGPLVYSRLEYSSSSSMNNDVIMWTNSYNQNINSIHVSWVDFKCCSLWVMLLLGKSLYPLVVVDFVIFKIVFTNETLISWFCCIKKTKFNKFKCVLNSPNLHSFYGTSW